MPRDFEFPLVPGQLNRSELWVPMSLTPGELTGRGHLELQMVGRLKPGVTPAQAQQDADARGAARSCATFPGAHGQPSHSSGRAAARRSTVAQARPLVRTLFLAVAVVLFIACANLAGLAAGARHPPPARNLGAPRAGRQRRGSSAPDLWSKPAAERRRRAAGAWPWRRLALRVGVSFLPETLPRISSIALDWQVVAFALAAGRAHRLVVRAHSGLVRRAHRASTTL